MVLRETYILSINQNELHCVTTGVLCQVESNLNKRMLKLSCGTMWNCGIKQPNNHFSSNNFIVVILDFFSFLILFVCSSYALAMI